jgi:IS5 family transposase
MQTSIFFSGVFKDGPLGADPDARIGYCAARKLAYVGYKNHLLCSAEDMTVLNFIVTPANIHDSKLFIPLLSRSQNSAWFSEINAVYGDNAYDSESNTSHLGEQGIEPRFHTKDETGKDPKKPKSAKRKSKKRSKIEVLFGISHENLGFGRVRVRGVVNVKIDTSLIFSGWNLGILYSYFIDRMEDHISLKKLLYKN